MKKTISKSLFFLLILSSLGCDKSISTSEIKLDITPPQVSRGETTWLLLSAKETDLAVKSTEVSVSPGNGFIIAKSTTHDGITIIAEVYVSDDAELGKRTVTVNTDDVVATGRVEVVDGDSSELELNCEPNVVKQGEEVTVSAKGNGTGFDSAQSNVRIAPPEGVELSNLQIQSSDQATFDVSVSNNSAVGSRVVSIVTGGKTATCNLLIDQGDPGPGLSVTLEPSEIQAGTQVSLVASGTNTHFSAESRVELDSGSGIAISDINCTSETQIAFTAEAEITAAAGNRTLTIKSPVGEGEETVTGDLRVIAAPSMVADPSSGIRGAEDLSIRLIGTNTNFIKGTSLQVTTDSGIQIVSHEVVNSSLIEMVMDIAEDATPGEVDISASNHTPPVTATFTVLEKDSDAGTDPIEDGGIDAGPSCNDIDIDPNIISVGRYGVSMRVRGDHTNWTNDTKVELIGELDHIFLDSFSVNTRLDIRMTVTAGLFATPQDLELHITEGGETLCGTLTILGEEIHNTTVPSGLLPAYSSYTSEVDAVVGDWYEFYKVHADPGDFLIFHAIPEDRVTLDVVLRMIDETGDEPLLYVNDETKLGVDARFARYFKEGGDFYIGVGTWGQSEYGDFDFYIYRLTHGSIINESTEDNNALTSPETIIETMPFVLYGAIDAADDVDVFEITTDKAAAIDVVARRLGTWEGSTADTILTVYETDQTEITSNSTWYQVPITADPRVFLDLPGTYLVKVEAEEDTQGFYALNVRSRVVINELDNRKISTDPYVELLGPADYDLSNHEICTYGPDGEPIDALNPCVLLDGMVTNSGGYFDIRHSDLELVGAETLNLPLEQAGAVVLLDNGKTIDKVQYGEVTSGLFAEGDPSEVGERRTIGRGAGVDTNNNNLDFIYMGDWSPGMPNDRAYQAAVPPYLEPEG